MRAFADRTWGILAGVFTWMLPGFLIAGAAIAAFTCGYFLWKAADVSMRKSRIRDEIASDASVAPVGTAKSSGSSFEGRIIAYMQRLSRSIAMGKDRTTAPAIMVRLSERSFANQSRMTGLGDSVTVEGFCGCRIRCAFIGLASGTLIGAIFSSQLAVALGIAGSVGSFMIPDRMLRARVKRRANEMEMHLPEMLDVVALGMRSGMSFDTSLALYGRHFDSILSRELMNSQRQWMSGLAMRDEALRKVASTYDSTILSRTFETVIRSIRYGTSMVESMESDASEAREAFQAAREEKVAKAPVKMLIPTGVLILPAMLILVLGPVLLELMGSGI